MPLGFEDVKEMCKKEITPFSFYSALFKIDSEAHHTLFY